MKIGLFDSGLGGLIVTHSVVAALPQYDYVYLGDTARVPYGNRSQATIYEFTKHAVEYLFEQNCQLVIVACNTASAEALRKIQQEFLPAHYPDRRVLGVLIPAAEEAVTQTQNGKIGVIATKSTVDSRAYIREIHKLSPHAIITQQSTPLLVPLIENNALQYADPMLNDYLAPLLSANIDTLILGCTHYPVLKHRIQQKVGTGVNIIAQDDVIPAKLTNYLQRHPEVESTLTKHSTQQFFTTDFTPTMHETAVTLFGEDVQLQQAVL